MDMVSRSGILPLPKCQKTLRPQIGLQYWNGNLTAVVGAFYGNSAMGEI